MLRLISVLVCGLLFACGQPNATCTKGDRCVHYLSGLPGPSPTGGNPPSGDMARAAAAGDMAHAAAPDLATASSTDMATASSDDMVMACVGPGGDCTPRNDAICCSGYCIYATNLCR